MKVSVLLFCPILLCIQLFSLTALPADPKNALNTEIFTMKNADRITHQEGRLRFTRHGPWGSLKSFNVEAVHINDQAEWLKFDGNKYLANADFQIGPQLFIISSLGSGEIRLHHFLKNSYHVSKTLTLWRLKSIYTPLLGTDFRFEMNNDYSYLGWHDRRNRPQIMTVGNAFFEAETFSFKDWQLRTNFRRSEFSDSNSQHATDHLILRSLASGKFDFKLGVGGGSMAFEKRIPGYWAPEHFETYGIRTIMNLDFTERWNSELRVHYGYHQEKGHRRGKDVFSEYFLNYNHPSGWKVNVKATYLDVRNGAWWRSETGINVQIPI